MTWQLVLAWVHHQSPANVAFFVGADIDEVSVAGTSQGWLFGVPVLALNLPGFHVTRPDVASSSQSYPMLRVDGAIPCCVLTPVPLRRDAVCGSNNWTLFQAFGIVFEDSRSLRHGVQSSCNISEICGGPGRRRCTCPWNTSGTTP